MATLATNSYGSITETGALVRRWSGSAFDFNSGGFPDQTQIVSEMDQISAMVNICLAENGFSIPVTDAEVVLMLDGFVNKMSAEIANGMHGAGRFGPTSGKKDTRGKWLMIMEDAKDFISMNAVGMERLGATRTFTVMSDVSYRSVDGSGDATHPIFQREQYGEGYDDSDT